MKIEPYISDIDSKSKTELSIQKKQQIQRELIGKIIPHNNHTIWEINIETLEINKAKFINHPAIIIGEPFRTEILERKGYAYISALNKGNALKKYNKGNNGSKVIISKPYIL